MWKCVKKFGIEKHLQRQYREELMGESDRTRNFDICFCVISSYYGQSLISRSKAGH